MSQIASSHPKAADHPNAAFVSFRLRYLDFLFWYFFFGISMKKKSFYVCISGKFFGAYIKIKTVTVIKMIIMTRMRVGDGGELRVLGDDEGSQGGINHPRSDQITISTKINFSSKSTLFGGGASDREKKWPS